MLLATLVFIASAMGTTMTSIFFAVAVTITTIFQFATTAILLLGNVSLFSFCFDFGVLFAFVL